MLQLLTIDYMGYAGASLMGVQFVINLKTESKRFPKLKRKELGVSVVIPFDKEQLNTYRLVSKQRNQKGEVAYRLEEEKFSVKEFEIIEEWCEQHRIHEKADNIVREFEEQQERLFELYTKLEQVNGMDFKEGKSLPTQFYHQEESEYNFMRVKELRSEIEEISEKLRELGDNKVG